MDSIDVTPTDSEVTVEVSLERLYEELSQQGTLGKDMDGHEYFYLAALALELRGEEDIEYVLMEFIRNCSELEHVTREGVDRIEDLLR